MCARVPIASLRKSDRSKDKPTSAVREVPTINEIRTYQDACYISASEAAWRIFSFPVVEPHPTVERLEVHMLRDLRRHYDAVPEASNLFNQTK